MTVEIAAAREKPTSRSWAFLGFKVPLSGEQIVNDQLSSLIASRPQLTSTEYSSCQLAAPTHESWIGVGSRYYRPISDDLMPSLPPPSPRPLSQPSCWSGEIIPPHLRSLIHKGTTPDHDAWLSRPAPPPIRKRGISQISAPVIPLDFRTPVPVLTASVHPHHSLGIFRPAVLTHGNPAAVSRVTLSVPDLGPQCMSAKALGKQRCDHVTPPVTSTPTRTILDRSRVDIQRPLDSSDDHHGDAACRPPLHIQQTVQVHEAIPVGSASGSRTRTELSVGSSSGSRTRPALPVGNTSAIQT